MANLSAGAARWSYVLHGVLVELGDVSVGGEECSGGRSAVAAPRVDMRALLLLYIELGESLYNGVPKGLVIVSLICRGVSEPLTANPKLLSPSEASSLR